MVEYKIEKTEFKVEVLVKIGEDPDPRSLGTISGKGTEELALGFEEIAAEIRRAGQRRRFVVSVDGETTIDG